MLLLGSIPAALAFSSFTLASPAGQSSRDTIFNSSVVEKLNGLPAGWKKADTIKIDKDVEGVKLRIHLVQQGMDKFHDMAMRVRDFFSLLTFDQGNIWLCFKHFRNSLLCSRSFLIHHKFWYALVERAYHVTGRLHTSTHTDAVYRLLPLEMSFMEATSPSMSLTP
jgi:hypothetical protein